MTTNSKQIEDCIYGESAVRTFFDLRNEDLIRLFVREGEQGRFKEILSECARMKKLYRLVPNGDLDKLSKSKHHEGICAVTKPKRFKSLPTLISEYVDKFSGEPLVILDEVGNPHNIGSIMRNAAFFGFNRLILNTKSSIKLSGSLMRTSEGGGEYCSVGLSKSTAQLIEILKEKKIKIVVSDLRAESSAVEEHYMQSPYAIVLGNEVSGVSNDLLKAADLKFKISGADKVQSLNVSVSAGIIFNEIFSWKNS